jgi:F0F1-type ATP synthase assembly protein I
MGTYMALAQVGIEMVLPLGIGVWLDLRFGWTPWALIAGTILGFVGGLVHLVVLAQRSERDQSKKKGS